MGGNYTATDTQNPPFSLITTLPLVMSSISCCNALQLQIDFPRHLKPHKHLHTRTRARRCIVCSDPRQGLTRCLISKFKANPISIMVRFVTLAAQKNESDTGIFFRINVFRTFVNVFPFSCNNAYPRGLRLIYSGV